jgi:hypothetical protein
MAVPLWGQSAESDTNLPAGNLIFKIGKVDKKGSDFKPEGFKGVNEFICTAGIDCDVKAFPLKMYRMSETQRFDKIDLSQAFDNSGVARVNINFTLDQDYKKAVLRLARTGLETTVVTVDDQQTHLVTYKMLGSLDSDHFLSFGAYDLNLGSLNKATHSIQLTVAEDGEGDGVFVWDALILVAE